MRPRFLFSYRRPDNVNRCAFGETIRRGMKVPASVEGGSVEIKLTDSLFTVTIMFWTSFVVPLGFHCSNLFGVVLCIDPPFNETHKNFC